MPVPFLTGFLMWRRSLVGEAAAAAVAPIKPRCEVGAHTSARGGDGAPVWQVIHGTDSYELDRE
jgi:hypothetical protein